MSADISVVLGSQWGDEGKGKLVDQLAQRADVVCRFSGGNNCGHTVVVNGIEYDFHLIPSGAVNPNTILVLGNGLVIHLGQLLDEIRLHEAKGLKNIRERMIISDRAHIVFDFHQEADRYQELERSKEGAYLGTTKKGIGPAYSSKTYRNGIRVGELLEISTFEKKLRQLAAHHMRAFPGINLDVDAELIKCYQYLTELRNCIRDSRVFLEQCIDENRKILLEGANATMLDIDFGTYPYVTSSHATIGGVCTGLGLPIQYIQKIYGVFKSYCTRVGDGPFPTEQLNEIGNYLQTKGRELGVTTRRKRRCGWLDMVSLRYSCLINNYNSMAMTKLDILDDLDEIWVGVRYKLDGRYIPVPPSCIDQLKRVEVEYEKFRGWKCNTTSCRTFASLPSAAQDYINSLELLLQRPIKWIGVGPDRDAIIVR